MSAWLTHQVDQNLKQFNTLGVAARAAHWFELHDQQGLVELHQTLSSGEFSGPPLFIGGGSNLLLTTDPPDPIVRICLRGVQQIPLESKEPDGVIVEAMAGENWHEFVTFCLSQGWYGLENLSLIPGSVGASPIQNIGAYGVEVKDLLEDLTAWNWRTQEIRKFRKSECQFGYRDSIFKQLQPNPWVILSVRFRLHRNARRVSISYGELREALRLEGVAAEPTPEQVSKVVCQVRSKKLPDPAKLGNAGSFFKNPILKTAIAEDLKQRFPLIPLYPAQEGCTKISAGWLIDQSGWKGFRRGNAGVHHAHALVLVNYGDAKGAEIKELAEEIQRSVANKFGIALEPEPVFWPPIIA